MDRGPVLPPPPPSSVRTAGIVVAIAGAGLALGIGLILASDSDADVRGDRSPADARTPDVIPLPGGVPIPGEVPAELTIAWSENDVLTYEILTADEIEFELDTGETYGGVYRNDARFDLHVIEAGPNGRADVEVTVPAVTLLEGVNDTPVGVARPQPLRFRRDMAQDRLLELSATADGQSNVIGLLWPPLPSTAVHPGEAWPLRRKLANAHGSGGVSFDGLCRFVGYESLQGLETALVSCRADATIDMVLKADLVAASTGLPVEETARNGTLTMSGTAYLWLSAWIDPTRDVVVRAWSHQEVDLQTRREGFETPWYTEATTVGTTQHLIELVERPSGTVLTIGR